MIETTTTAEAVTLPSPDIALVETFWQKFVCPGEVYEVRITDSRRGPARLWKTCAGYFTAGQPSLLKAIGRLTGLDAQAVYVTLNPVRPTLLARANNRLVTDVKSTAQDGDVARRAHFLIDVDPKRPAGISATTGERDDALTARDAIRDYLEDAGWPAPLYSAMSGNGGSLVYQIGLPNDDESTELVSNCLAALGHSFETETVSVDQTVSNAARLTKIPGTVAAKGDNVPEIGRIWRVSQAQFYPDAKPVMREQLEALAALAPEAPAARSTIFADISDGRGRSWTVAEVLKRSNVGYFEKHRAYGTAYILDTCLTSTAHTDGAAILERADGALGYRCHHNSCQEKGWRDAKPALGLADRDGQSPAGPSGLGGSGPAAEAPPPTLVPEPSWPDPIDPAAFHGLPGDAVRAIAPHTEADPAALLVQFLVAFGSAINRTAHFVAEADRHALNENVALVGASAKGRKGSSWGHVRRLFEAVDRDWTYDRVQSGLSSGEGLIWAVRDPITKQEPVKEGGRPTGEHQEIVLDPGVSDKRLLVMEPEFASTLRVLGREGSTLSAQIRQAWDSGHLRSMTKNSPAKATGAHISIVGHITRDELRRYLDVTEAANGFGNRFLWLAVRRSKTLPEGGQFDRVDVEPLVRRLREALDFGRRTGEIRRDDTAREIWRAIYPALSEGKPGLLGAMIARGEPHVMRLACTYALLDLSAVVRREHLLAALALWDYAEASARWIFGQTLGDPVADEILRALKAGPAGTTRTEISELFGRHKSAGQIGRALESLAERGLARMTREEPEGGKGRPVERWFAVPAST